MSLGWPAAAQHPIIVSRARQCVQITDGLGAQCKWALILGEDIFGFCLFYYLFNVNIMIECSSKMNFVIILY